MDAPTPTPAPLPKNDPLSDGTYIRTFAKDVAKITGKPIQEGKVVVPKAELSLPKKPKTLEEELTPDQGSLSASAFAETRTTPQGPEAAIDAARAKILARLKTKAPAAPEVRPAAVLTPPKKFETPPPPPVPVRTKDDVLSPLHTFKTDFAEKVGREHASKITVLAAEGNARPARVKPVQKPLNVNSIAIAVGAVLIIGGGASIFLAVKFANTSPPVPANSAAPSLIFADTTKELTGTGRELMQALADTATQPLPDKGILVTFITDSTTTPKGVTSTTPLPGGALIRAMQLEAPDILLRNMDESSTVGVIRAGSETRPFFVLRVSSYERTFAGMLAWESSMAHDLGTIYPPYQNSPFVAQQNASSIAATSSVPKGTTIIIPPPTAPLGFSDEVVANHDVRVLYDAQRRVIVLYGYRDKNTLIIARDRAAFAALLDRLSSTRSQ